MKTSLLVEGLEARYESGEGVTEVSFRLEAGQVGVIIGPNGAGKSTLMKALSTLLPFKGRVQIDNLDPVRGSEYRRAIAFLPDDPNLPRWLTGKELSGFVQDLWGEDSGYPARFVQLVGKFFGQGTDVLKKTVQEYSRGMEQRLGLALTLARAALLYMFDEPDAHLDAISAHRLRLELKSLAQRGKIVLLSTHDPYMVLNIADRTFLIREGRLWEAQRSQTVVDLLALLEDDRNGNTS